MSDKFKSLVILNGGLGNQLFQLSRSLAASDNHVIYLNDTIGFPRKETTDKADLFSFHMSFIGGSMPLGEKKGLNRFFNQLFLHFVVSRNTVSKKILTEYLFRMFHILNSKELQGKWNNILGEGAGWNVSQAKNANLVIFGYFQSWKWPSIPQVRSLMMKMVPNDVSDLFKQLKENGNSKKILVVHRRIGDYVKDEGFGILPLSYYQRAIKKCLEMESIDEIWLFADTPNVEFPIQEESVVGIPIRKIPQELSPVETLELMRYGTSYIIANSSFSWWGAFLSYTESPLVIAPTKWFKGMVDPRDICPLNWVRIRSW